MRPRRDQAIAELAISAPDLAAFDGEASRFPPEVRERAADILASVDAQVKLSELLDRAIAESPGIQELIALTVLHEFAPEERGGTALRVEKVPGSELRTSGFSGDEMLIMPAASGDGAGPVLAGDERNA